MRSSTEAHLELGCVALGFLCFAASGCTSHAPAMPESVTPEVVVSKPLRETVTDYFEFPGQTAAVEEVEVRARVFGHIIKRGFEDGQEVKRGQLLFEIDPRPYEAAQQQAVGDLARAEASLTKAEADLTRAQRLLPSAAISQTDYEQSVLTKASTKALVASARAAARNAELNLEFTRVVSPIDGRVSRAQVTPGNLVQGGAGAATLLTTVVTISPVYVYFNIDESTLLRYEDLLQKQGKARGQTQLQSLKLLVEIGLANEEGFPHRGYLDFVDNKVDPNTGTIRARGVFDNAQQYLTPGLFVRVRTPFGDPHPAMLISDRAVGIDQNQRYLLVVNQKNIVERRAVRVGGLHDGLRAIESGVGPDDLVVVSGLMRARPGATVRPKQADVQTSAATSVDRGKVCQVRLSSVAKKGQ
jgi:RND family efflux transporter MFP subunit